MSGNTPNQGFLFATVDDAPCALPATFAALNAQVDAKSSGLDVDGARMQANNFVSISYSNSSSATMNGFPGFNVVDVDRGTATDLSAFNGLIIGPGFWMVGLTAQLARWSPPAIAYPMTIALSVAGESATTDAFLVDYNAFGFPLAGNTMYAGGLNLGVPQQLVSVVAMANPSAAATKVSANIQPSGDPISYAQMWAWQIGDL
jgi:hypothetical protein